MTYAYLLALQIENMDKTALVESYKTNTLKEELVTAFVENFK